MAQMGTGIGAGNGLGGDTRASRPNRAPNGRRKQAGKGKGRRWRKWRRGDRVEQPVKMFVTTDEQGKLKMLPVRTRATQRDEEPGVSANANVQLSETRPPPPLPQAEVPSPPPRPPLAKPMVPRRILPQTDGNFHTAQPLVGHPQSTPNALVTPIARESGVAVVREVPGGDLLAHQHAPPHMASSLPACSPAPLAAASTTAIGRNVAPLPRYATSYNHFETWNVGFMDIESEYEAQLLSAARGRVTLLDRVVVLRFGASSKFCLYTRSAPLPAIRCMYPCQLNITNLALLLHLCRWHLIHM